MNHTVRQTIAGFVSVLAIALLAVPLAADAQQASKIWRVGSLQPSPSANTGHASFRQGSRANPGTAEQLKATRTVAERLGLTMHVVWIDRPGDYGEVFAQLARERVGAVLVLTDTVLAADRRQIVETATRHQLPTFFDFRESVGAGGLLSYGVNNLDSYRQAARFVDRILKGAKPADLPEEQPTKFERVINLRTAKAFGLMIPTTARARADHGIE